LGLGTGNTSDEDYAAAGVAADHRYARFAEHLQIIHPLLREGAADFAGTFASARHARLPLRGPHPTGPPIVVAAQRPKTMQLAARFADEWNGFGDAVPQTVDGFRPLVEQLARACESVQRDPATLRRSLYLVLDASSVVAGAERSDLAPYLVHGSLDQVAEQLLGFAQLGIDEVWCSFSPQLPPDQRASAVAGMEPVVKALHAG
jgi:alkanesulfonate monooxygenase SsuD/methylene tetrahydromethanopterin reductase-like flavin-dependent oxidoreductase (luciferase family)